MRSDTKYLQEAAVYPGHPITIAYLITKTYSSFEEAFKKGEKTGYEAALADNNIPGAGGNVGEALSLLHYLRSRSFKKRAKDLGCSEWEAAIRWADDCWTHCDGQGPRDLPVVHKTTIIFQTAHLLDRWQRGQEQADRVKPLLKKQRKWWKLAK